MENLKKPRIYKIGKLPLTNNSIIPFILIIIYKIILDLSYMNIIVPMYGYMGFRLEFNFGKFIISSLIIIFCFFTLKRSNKISHIFLFLHFVIMIIPMSTMVAYMNKSILFFIMCISCFLLEIFLIEMIPDIGFKPKLNFNLIKNIILILITVSVMLFLIFKLGMPTLKALNLNNVYDIREETQFSGFFGYLIVWQAKVINPILIADGMNKNKRMCLIGIILQFVLFLYTGHKSYLFIILAVIAVMKMYEICKHKSLYFNGIFIKIFTTVIIVIVAIAATSIGLYLFSYFIRRFLIVPANLKFNYYEFFSVNDFANYSQSFIGKIFQTTSIYKEAIPTLIGRYFYSDTTLYANAGYLADAYANLGYIGMILNSLLFVVVMKLLDSFGKLLNPGLILGTSIFLIIGLNDTSLITSMMTGGLMFLLLILYLMASSKKEREDRNKI